MMACRVSFLPRQPTRSVANTATAPFPEQGSGAFGTGRFAPAGDHGVMYVANSGKPFDSARSTQFIQPSKRGECDDAIRRLRPPGGGREPFEWPLDATGMRMDAGELLDSLLATIQHLNRTDAWPLTILPPRWGDVVVDRERRQISAVCLWKRKPIKNHKED